jgi:hypothetical protein
MWKGTIEVTSGKVLGYNIYQEKNLTKSQREREMLKLFWGQNIKVK